MPRLKILLFCIFLGGRLLAQEAISGYVNLENASAWEQKVFLSRIAVKDLAEQSKTRLVATTPIDKNGYFTFERKLLSDKESVYRLYVKAIEKAVQDSVKNDQLLLLSKQDRVVFKKGNSVFADYTTTNKADREWQRLRRFEKQFYAAQRSNLILPEYEKQYKTFARDSLQILMVKLISIRELEHKKLLDKDISENPEYYHALLEELKSSEIAYTEYLFLEQKLTSFVQESTTQNFKLSVWLNLVLTLVVVCLIWTMLKIRRKKRLDNTIPLSRQENNVMSLIIAGKSNKEIANELFISVSTVKTHITNIYQKLNISGRQELLGRK